jgi:ATP synthase protein I
VTGVEEGRFRRTVEEEGRRLERAGRARHSFWRQASLVGGGGWLFVVPVVGGAYLGRWLDRRLADEVSWTITGIVVGVGIGAWNLWHSYGARGGR